MKQLITLSVIVLLGAGFLGNSIMNTMAGEMEKGAAEKYYTSIEIRKGDSLWSISERYRENSGLTTAQYMNELKNMNGLKEDIIHHGQYLTVMYFITDSD